MFHMADSILYFQDFKKNLKLKEGVILSLVDESLQITKEIKAYNINEYFDKLKNRIVK